MLSEKLTKLLSEQITHEYDAAYKYLAMSAAADGMGLKGIASWFYSQAKEEVAHGTHIFQYVLERGAIPTLGHIEQPPAKYADIQEIFEAGLAHERKVTGLINNIATAAMQAHDHACYNFMMWFVNEQVEEEASFSEILDKLKLMEDNKGMLFALDNELGTRVFVNPFPNQ